MKISKLFHWLYAFLMLLPVFFIGGRCLYVTFNKNAKDSYYGGTINESTQIFINDSDDFVSNTKYTFMNSYIGNQYTIGTSSSRFNCINWKQGDDYYENVYFYFYKASNSTTLFMYLKYLETDASIFIDRVVNASFTFSFQLGSTSVTNDTLTDLQNDFYRIEYNNYSYLDNAFIYSVNSLNDVPLFSWAKTSFLVEPFTYISGLFGIASTNPINTMLSYWLAISIIWLVFDLIMYVPLLVHRWIDKAKLE